MAYKAQEGGKWFVVYDGKEGERFDNVGTPEFSGFIAPCIYRGEREKQMVVLDGKKHAAYDGIPQRTT